MLAGRQLRIWPVLFIVVGLFIGLAYVDGGSLTGQIKTTWPYYLFYLGNIPKLMYGAEAFPSHLWVIGVQEQWIVAFCLTVMAVGVKGFRKLLWPLVGFGVAARLAGILAYMPEHPSWALETPFAVLDALALGMLARFAIEEKVTRGRLRRLTWAALLLSITAWVFLPNSNAAYFTLVPLATSLLTSFLIVTLTDEARGQRAYQAFFGNPLLVMLGRMSLSAFLLHPFINTVIRLVFTNYTGVEMPWWLLSIVGPVASFGVAYVFWLAIETPLRNARARMKGAPRPPAPAAPAAELSSATS
jgi:peptidoglycan/LPS O-acetylase OafA/YrhL